MSVLEYNASHNSSSSSQRPLQSSQESIDVTKAKNYVKDLLKSRIFLGRYLERQLIDERIGYRDIVCVSSAEVDLKRDLLEAQHILRKIYPKHWIGVSENESLGYSTPGLAIWTEIDNQPFGPFWFQVRSVKFRDEEIMLTVKCLRHISDSYLELEPILTGAEKKSKDVKAVSNTETLKETYTEIASNLRDALSISNVKDFITFLVALIIAVFTGSTAFINFLGNFVLALVREISLLVKNSTPMFLGFLDFLSKIVGGFYILVAMIFRTSSLPPINKRTVAHYETQRPSSQYYNEARTSKQYYNDRDFD